MHNVRSKLGRLSTDRFQLMTRGNRTMPPAEKSVWTAGGVWQIVHHKSESMLYFVR